MKSERKRNHPLNLAVRWIKEWGDGRQATLAARSGISESTIRRFENGRATPRLRQLEALAAGVELPVPLAEFLSWCQAMAQGGQATASEPDAEVSRWRSPDKGLTVAIEKLVQAAAPKEDVSCSPASAGQGNTDELVRHLLSSSKEERRCLLEATLEYRSWALVELVCQESRRQAAHDPKEALELAELALAIAELTPGEPALRWRVQGLALFTVANAWRVSGNLPVAREKWDEAKKLWQAGAAADPGFSESLIQSLVARALMPH